MGTLYRFRFFCQVVCCAIALGAFCRFFRPRFAISPYYKRTYASFTQKETANIYCNILSRGLSRTMLQFFCNGIYLLKCVRAGHLNYGEMRRRKFPIGSGVIESTIRRVVNLRLKGASVYWKESTANDMLLLRCLYKANRWESIEKQGKIAVCTAA